MTGDAIRAHLDAMQAEPTRAAIEPDPDRWIPTAADVERMDSMDLVTDQDEWWRTKDGELLRVTNMTESHRANLRALMDRTWDDSCERAGLRLSWAAGHTNGEMAELELDSMAEQAFEMIGTLHEQPLYRRLVALEEEQRAEVRREGPPDAAHVYDPTNEEPWG